MLKEALDKLCELISASHTPTRLECDDETKDRFVIDGKVVEFDRVPHDRRHSVESLIDLVTAAEWIDEIAGTKGAVFHNVDTVVLLLCDQDRYDRVTLDLHRSAHFATLEKLAQSKPLSQTEFVNLLKHDLRGCVPDTLLPIIRKISVQSKGSSSSEIQHGKERGMREFDQELSNASELPEMVSANVAVYRNPGLSTRRTVELTLSYDLAALTFTLRPGPDELHYAEMAAQGEIAEYIQNAIGEKVNIFNGRP